MQLYSFLALVFGIRYCGLTQAGVHPNLAIVLSSGSCSLAEGVPQVPLLSSSFQLQTSSMLTCSITLLGIVSPQSWVLHVLVSAAAWRSLPPLHPQIP